MQLILPLKDIENVAKEKGFRFNYYGMVVLVRGHEELFFEFAKAELRDECNITLLRQMENTKFMETSQSIHPEDIISEEQAKAEHDMLQAARIDATPAAAPPVAPGLGMRSSNRSPLYHY